MFGTRSSVFGNGLIGVRPKHYRAIVLEVLRSFPDATVWVDLRRCEDLSEAGPLTQRGIARMRDFEIRTEHASILGFHDHPREMWIGGEFGDLAQRLADLGHVRIERRWTQHRRPAGTGVKRVIVFGLLLPIAFIGSCFALLPPAVRLADPMTHLPLDGLPGQPFPVLVVERDQARVLMIEDLRRVPPLPDGATYLVPGGSETAFRKQLEEQAPRDRDVAWVLQVERLAPDRQRIELYLMGDGYWGGGYEVTHNTITPLYRKLTGPAFAFIFGGLALAMNGVLWGSGALALRAIQRRRTSRPQRPV